MSRRDMEACLRARFNVRRRLPALSRARYQAVSKSSWRGTKIKINRAALFGPESGRCRLARIGLDGQDLLTAIYQDAAQVSRREFELDGTVGIPFVLAGGRCRRSAILRNSLGETVM